MFKQPTRRTFLKGIGLLSVSGMALPLIGCQHNKADGGGGGARFDKSPTILMGGETSAVVEFIKDRVRIEAGDTITWELQSGGHTATAYHPDIHNVFPQRIPDGAVPFDSVQLFNKGDTFEHIFTVEGVYNYYCRPHEGQGMVGIIVVGKAMDGPGLAPIQPEISSVVTRRKLEELIEWAKQQT